MKIWQGFIIFTAGAVSGAVGSLFYLRTEFDKKVNEEVIARERIKTEFNDKEIEKEQRRIDSEASRSLSEKLGYSSDNVTSMIRETRTEPSRPIRNNYIGPNKVVFSVDENGNVDDSPSEGPADTPYGISSEDFIATRQEYDKTTLTFYMNDLIMANEEGDIVQDPAYLVGEREEWMREVGTSEDGIAYIRNEKIATDYEIICENKSYTDDWAT